jgi:predicted AlkP superfamily phosphohydrolase/phosphomutase
MRYILTYIDPGSGFVFAQNTSFLWGIILGLLGFLFFFFRFFLKFLKKFFWILFILLVVLMIGGLMVHKEKKGKKVIILGIDAMDPKITEQLIQEGRLPNLSYLKTRGVYSHLKTTMPAESVVAWTSFATGLNPGSHGIFDFIMRDPQNYLPYLSLNEISSVEGRIKIHIRRKGGPFWSILSKRNIPCFLYFCPNTFPPDAILGKMLSGMGVPDILGTMGKFSFYITKALSEEDKDSRGRIIHLDFKNNVVDTQIYGPKIDSDGSITESAVPLRITLALRGESISLEFQRNHLVLREGRWSNWQKISFKIGPFRKVYGIVRFYLKSIKPDFGLYVSPINFDPQNLLFHISYPYNYSKKLAKKIGLYYTQGMPHDTWALTENRLDERAFLELTDEILREREGILKNELEEFKRGVFFFYLDTLDAIQHMFWRYIDPQHPLYEKDSPYKDTIFKYYEKIDQIIGDVLRDIDRETILIVLSDHGFSSFRRAVHLNRWLLESGYLFLKDGVNKSKEFFEDVDWSKTRAYALGFGGIYLNRIDREYYGIVKESDIQELKWIIKKKLGQLCNPQNNEPIVKNVYMQEDIFQGPYKNDAPDLFVGFNAGYRTSWQTALGGVPTTIIEDNKKKWSGEHLVDSLLVPGVLFSNKKLYSKNSAIVDIAPTLLGIFNIEKPKEMHGNIIKLE